MSVYSAGSLPTTTTNQTSGTDDDTFNGVSGLPAIDTPRNSERSSSMDAEGNTEAGSEYDHSNASGGNGAMMMDIAASANELKTAETPSAHLPPPPRTKRGPPPMMMPPAFGSSGLDDDQQLPIRPNAEECLFYIHTGWCGYGKACRYNHPPEKMALHKPKAFNSLGLPLRENTADCSFFMRVGVCKFGATCKFNHPQKVVDEAVNNGRQPFLAQAAIAMQPGNTSLPATSVPSPMSASSPQRKPRGTSAPSSPMNGPVSPGYSIPNSPVLHASPAGGPMMFGGQLPPPPPMSPQAHYAPHGQPYIVYYVQPSMERCWSFATTGRCQMGHQCPYMHS